MPATKETPLVRHCIVRIGHPDDTFTAMEMIVEKNGAETINVTRLPDTERKLPLLREEAEQWVSSLPDEIPEEERKTMVDMLCCIDSTEN